MNNDVAVSRYDLTRIENTLGQVEARQAALSNAVDQVAVRQDATRSDLLGLRQRFDEFLAEDRLSKNLTKAQNAYQLLGREFDNSFGHYDDVRRQGTGILQALDTGIVTKRTISQVSEELMLGTPRYWLSPALVAVAAWIRDDRVLAERALAEAVRRDPGKTSLFLTLVLRRQGRTQAASRWLHQYVARQDPGALPREFVVVLDAVAVGAFGPEARPVVLDTMTGWYDRIRSDQAIVESQVKRWRTLMIGMRHDDVPHFPVLAEVSPTWPVLREVYLSSVVFGQAAQYFRGVFAGPLPVSDDLRDRVDDILTSLVSNFDDEEAPLRREMDRLQAIIDHDGDEERAAKVVALEGAARDERSDLLTLLTNAAFTPQKVGASRATQRLAVALTSEWIVEAAGRMEADITAKVPRRVKLSIDGWTGALDRAATEQGLVASVARHIDERTEQDVARTGVGVAAGLTAVLGAVAFLFAVMMAVNGAVAGAVVFVSLVVACGFWVHRLFRQRDRRRAELRAFGEQRKALAANTVNGAIAEARDWWDAWQRQMSAAEPLRVYLSGLVREAHTGTAHNREVLD